MRAAKRASSEHSPHAHFHAGKRCFAFFSQPARKTHPPCPKQKPQEPAIVRQQLTRYTSTPPPAFTKRTLAACLRVGLCGSSAFLTCRKKTSTQKTHTRKRTRLRYRSSHHRRVVYHLFDTIYGTHEKYAIEISIQSLSKGSLFYHLFDTIMAVGSYVRSRRKSGLKPYATSPNEMTSLLDQ